MLAFSLVMEASVGPRTGAFIDQQPVGGLLERAKMKQLLVGSARVVITSAAALSSSSVPRERRVHLTSIAHLELSSWFVLCSL